jgi:hypothetical protein
VPRPNRRPIGWHGTARLLVGPGCGPIKMHGPIYRYSLGQFQRETWTWAGRRLFPRTDQWPRSCRSVERKERYSSANFVCPQFNCCILSESCSGQQLLLLPAMQLHYAWLAAPAQMPTNATFVCAADDAFPCPIQQC